MCVCARTSARGGACLCVRSVSVYCAVVGGCMHVLLLRDDRRISSRTQAHTLACTVQIHTSLLLYTHRGCVVMQLLH